LQVHDEYLVEVPEDEDLKYHYENVQRIMISAMEKVIPHVKISTEAEITRRWSKQAKQLFREDGYPLIWDDLPQNRNKESICDMSKEILVLEED
jgi:hypothetical protein